MRIDFVQQIINHFTFSRKSEALTMPIMRSIVTKGTPYGAPPMPKSVKSMERQKRKRRGGKDNLENPKKKRKIDKKKMKSYQGLS